MQADIVIRALAALAQDHRLAAYRLLVQAGGDGIAAGALAKKLAVPPSSISLPLAQLTHAGLVTQRRESRSIIYSADYSAMNAVMGYLTENCCDGADCSQDNALANQFENASLLLIRLAPNDYHRFHFPYAGKASVSKLIDGAYYSVSPYAVKENFTIFCENKREYSILKTEDKGDILISEIGATMVGAIFQTYPADTTVTKGQEKGYFAFGGSSVILLVDADKIKIDADILENTKNGFETTVLMGERIGL